MRMRRILRHSIIKTLYFNFKILPIKQAIRLPFDLCGKVRLENLSGRVKLNFDEVTPGMLKIGTQGSDMFPASETVVSIEGDITFCGRFVMGMGSSLICRRGGSIVFGDNTIIGARTLLFCEKEIILDDGFLTSWDCQIMDSDTHYIIDMQANSPATSKKEISIGKHVWIGNGVIINKGTKLPSDSIVASRSLCNKNYMAEGTNCVFAGSPAKVVTRNKKWTL